MSHSSVLEPTPTSYVQVCALASGGMGRVELAMRKEGSFRRLYAVKRLHPHLRSDEDFRAMFLDEARVAGLIQHPNIVSVLDVGEDTAGPFLVMNYIDGMPLSKVLSCASKKGEEIPVQVCVRIALEIAKGLHAAHEVTDHKGTKLNLVHRDLSPQNVLVSFSGNVRITDFGIAKALGQGTKTATGVIKGKMSYLSPEQLRFEEPDRRSDLFALGIVLYEMLSGERLYKNREGSDGVRRILSEPAPDIGEVRVVPPELEQLLLELLAKKPAHRPETAGSTARRLEVILGELIGSEESLELSAYVQSIAGDETAAQKAEIQAAIETAETAQTQMRKPRRPLVWGLAAALAIGGVSAALVWGPPGEAAAPAVTAAPAEQPATTTIEEPAEAQVQEVEEVDEQVDEEVVPAVAPRPEEPPVETVQVTQMRPRPRPRPAPDPPPSTMMTRDQTEAGLITML